MERFHSKAAGGSRFGAFLVIQIGSFEMQHIKMRFGYWLHGWCKDLSFSPSLIAQNLLEVRLRRQRRVFFQQQRT